MGRVQATADCQQAGFRLKLTAGRVQATVLTLAGLLLQAFLDEQEAGTLRAEGHHHQTQHGWHGIEGKQIGPQGLGACQQVKQVHLGHHQGNSRTHADPHILHRPPVSVPQRRSKAVAQQFTACRIDILSQLLALCHLPVNNCRNPSLLPECLTSCSSLPCHSIDNLPASHHHPYYIIITIFIPASILGRSPGPQAQRCWRLCCSSLPSSSFSPMI